MRHKHILILVVSLFLLVDSFAQQVYIGSGLGAGHSLFKKVNFRNNELYYSNLQGIKERIVTQYGTYGTGVSAVFQVGIQSNKSAFVEMKFGCFRSQRYTSNFTVIEYDNSRSNFLNDYYSEYAFINPNFGVKLPFWEKWNVKLYGGPLIFKSYFYDKYYYLISWLRPNSIDRTDRYENPIEIGSQLGLTLEKTLNKDFDFFVELSYRAVFMNPSKSEYTEYKLSGRDEIETLDISERYATYSNNYELSLDQNFDVSVDPDLPSTYSAFSIDLSAFYIHAGVNLRLGGKKKEVLPVE